MAYYIDLCSISIDDYEKKLGSSYLLPSRMILKEQLEKHFLFFRKSGIKNLHQLQLGLKKKGNIEKFSKDGGLSSEYLTILLREINSIHPKPNK